MPFGARKIYPIDNQPRKAVGVSLDFSKPGVFQPTYTTREAIKANLVNYFLTNRGERVFRPEIGGELQRYIFENISSNTLENIETTIRDQVSLYFPSVIIGEINITQNTETNSIGVEMIYNIQDTGISDSLEISFG